ncbi:MAG: hypothetical protein GY754_20220 [bacterium]|nr:hypothetical protein [bacterium]
MKNEHIPFDMLSDLYDGLIATEEEKETLLDHIDSCPVCRLEYEKLRKTISLMAELRKEEFDLRELSTNTIALQKHRARRRAFMKAMPAIAASLLIVFGGYWMTTRDPGGSNSITITDPRGQMGNTEKIVTIVRDQKGKIVKLTDAYVEGEIELKKFMKLRRGLGHKGFQKVNYRISTGSGPAAGGQKHIWRKGIENVGAGDIPPGNQVSSPTGSQKKYIRFRVYK